jgi:hypothetical protein
MPSSVSDAIRCSSDVVKKAEGICLPDLVEDKERRAKLWWRVGRILAALACGIGLQQMIARDFREARADQEYVQQFCDKLAIGIRKKYDLRAYTSSCVPRGADDGFYNFQVAQNVFLYFFKLSGDRTANAIQSITLSGVGDKGLNIDPNDFR